MTLVDQLSRRGIPYGIRRDGSVFVLAGDKFLSVTEIMPISDIVEARAALIAGRDAQWERLGNWASHAKLAALASRMEAHEHA